MPSIEIARWALLVLVTLLLGYVAAVDVKDRRIPNWTTLAVIGLFGAWAFVAPHISLLGSVEAFVIVLIFSIGLYMMGMIGAGDSKLVAAVSLFAGMNYLLQFLLMMSVAGGAVAIFLIVLSPRRVLAVIQSRGQIGLGRSVPYGVAIALAGVGTLVPQVTGIPLW